MFSQRETVGSSMLGLSFLWCSLYGPELCCALCIEMRALVWCTSGDRLLLTSQPPLS